MTMGQGPERAEAAPGGDNPEDGAFGVAPEFVTHLVKDHTGPIERRARPRATFVEAQRAYAATASRQERRMPSGWRRAIEA